LVDLPKFSECAPQLRQNIRSEVNVELNQFKKDQKLKYHYGVVGLDYAIPQKKVKI
jgi:hypothetical protein